MGHPLCGRGFPGRSGVTLDVTDEHYKFIRVENQV